MAYPGHSADDLQEDEDEARAWIEAVTQLQKPDDESFEAWLRSGVVLCTLLNALKPNSIKKISDLTFGLLRGFSAMLMEAVGAAVLSTIEELDLRSYRVFYGGLERDQNISF